MKAVFPPLFVAALIAAVINQVLYFIATGVFGQEFLLAQGDPMAIPVIAPAMFSIFQGLVGGLVVAWIALRTKSPQKVWTVISVIALVLSFVMPFGGIVGVGAALWLNLMHVVAGVLIIPAVRKALPATKAS
jgi:peptidoglycan/LPS O-acetylase OafA/YrhL